MTYRFGTALFSALAGVLLSALTASAGTVEVEGKQKLSQRLIRESEFKQRSQFEQVDQSKRTYQDISGAINGDNQVDVRVINKTGAMISYEAVSSTPNRMLMANENAMLMDLPLPLNMLVTRSDEGLVDLDVSVTRNGVIEMTVLPGNSIDTTQGAMALRPNGELFVY